MYHWLKRFSLGIGLLLLIVPPAAMAETDQANCEVCIVEIQTQGITDASEEYVVLANLSSQPKTGVTIQYLSAAGSKGVNAQVDLPANGFGVAVSPVLKASNPDATATWPSGISGTSGTIQLIYQGNVMDEAGWGTATVHEGAASVAHSKGSSLVRKQTEPGTWQDTGSNADDFNSQAHACTGLAFNEVQPLVMTADGQDISRSIELVAPDGSSTGQDCPLYINNTLYSLAAGDLHSGGALVAVYNVIDNQNQIIAIPLSTDSPNSLQFMPQSIFAEIALPGGSLTQPLLEFGQDYSKFTNGWKVTYSPTLGQANQLTTIPQAPSPEVTSPDNDCADIFVNELLPNPVGEDAGQEWIELVNPTDSPVFLSNCVMSVNGTQYSFAADQTIGIQGYFVFSDVTDGVSTRTISLKNSGLNTISFGRLNSNSTFEALQTIQYQEAAEGQGWARFIDGWRWQGLATPGLDNNTQSGSTSTDSQPTEFPASPAEVGTGGEDNDGSATSPALQLIITELLPNPRAPQTDENDEFIELYNAGIDAIDLEGYKVQTGTNYSYSFTLAANTLDPGAYLVLTSGQTGLTLANSTGRARLLKPDGSTASEAEAYENAKEGASWALIDGIWQWTASPTPGANNIPTKISLAASNKKVTAKTAAAAKTKTAKKTSAKVKAAKIAKTKKAAAKYKTVGEPSVESLHPAVLVAVGGIALVYGAYEYRQDMANAIYKFRRDRETRRTGRK